MNKLSTIISRISASPIIRDCLITRNTTTLMCLGTLLIANSHLEAYYPVSWLAADGLIGVSIFIFLSGYGLSLSQEKHERTFFPFYWQRILRMYPSLIAFVAFVFLFYHDAINIWSKSHMAAIFLTFRAFPLLYKFMLFYVGFFFLNKFKGRYIPLIYIGAIMLYVAFVYIETFASYTAGPVSFGHLDWRLMLALPFQTFLFGMHVARNDTSKQPSALKDGVCLILLLIAFITLKFLVVYRNFGYLFIIVLYLALPICFYLFKLVASKSFNDWLRNHFLLSALVTLLGNLTLEVYIFHQVIAKNGWVRSNPFPINIFMFFFLVISGSIIIKIAASIITRFCRTLTPSNW